MWSDWNAWSVCSTTCDPGNQTRRRQCDNPSPAFGGRDCNESKIEVKDCLLRNCCEGSKFSSFITLKRVQNI